MTLISIPLGDDRTPGGLSRGLERVQAALSAAAASELVDPGIRWTVDDVDLATSTALLRGVGASAESLARVADAVQARVVEASSAAETWPSLGAVCGRLEWEHDDPVIVDHDGGWSVRLPDEIDVPVALVGECVVVRGLVWRRQDTSAPVAVEEITSITGAEKSTPGGLRAARGIAPWLMEGEASIEDVLRRGRDA